ncbi:Chromatin assembly factor 1 subunit p50 [Ancistrocladus abbreviatus]
MASVSHSAISHAKSLASDHLHSSSSSINGVTLRVLGRTRFGMKRNELSLTAKLRKVKKHDYPWPEDPDPNVKGGVLTHLSHFKPPKERPKPVTLDFEKPLMDLQKKIVDVRKMANETGLDFTDQIASLENKYQQALKDLYRNLTPIQRVNIARHPNRPTFLDHVFNITEKFVELHGDRAGYDDPAIVTGLGTVNGRSYMFIGQQKGRNTKENIERNFGMPTPHGYRKALRMMYYADHHGFPIVTFIDTPGAYADLKSEELGQGEAIAHNLRTMFGLKVPIISIVIGEGGSGGALAIGCANKLFMLENAVFYVASPEACAAILWKTAKAAPKAAEKLKITAPELCKLEIADGIIPEPLGGAHSDPSWTAQQIKNAVVEAMDELVKMDAQELLQHRTQKFRKLGGFQEGLPVDPEKKVNMKKKEVPVGQTSNQELENEVEKLKEQVLKAKESSAEAPTPSLDEMIEKLQKEADHEISEAVKALGLEDRLMALQDELAKAKSSPDQLVHPALMDKIEKFKDELSQHLSTAPNYTSLNDKLNMLKELSKARRISETNMKSATLKQEINKKFKEIMDRPDVKQKIEALKADVEKSGASSLKDLDHELKERVMKAKEEIELEFASVLKSFDLDVKTLKSKATNFLEESLSSNLKSKIGELNEEIQKRIEDTVSSSDLKNKIDQLKLELAKAAKNPDVELQNRIRALQQDIKDSLAEAVSTSELVKKHEELQSEIAQLVESSEGADDDSSRSPSRVEANVVA